MRERGFEAAGLHGDLNQAQREKTMKRFRENRIAVLVCTDVAARGLDVDDVEARAEDSHARGHRAFG